MKKLILTLSTATFIFIGTGKAQIPNLDFEQWSKDPANAAAYDPNDGTPGHSGWQTFNIFSGFITNYDSVSVYKDSISPSPYQGKYACKIRSVVLNSASYNYVKAFLPHDTAGMIITGTISVNPTISLKLGIAYTSRITSFSYYYQYAPKVNVKPDTAFCSVVLTHKHNVLGAGTTRMNAAGSWTMGTVNIVYDSAIGNPDSVTILFSASSLYKPLPGSVLYVDAASVLGVNDINAPSAHVDVYPNPASTQVNFHISTVNGDEGYSIAVYDATGKKLNTYPVKNNLASISTGAYSAGLYFYELYDKNGAQMKMGKFSVVK